MAWFSHAPNSPMLLSSCKAAAGETLTDIRPCCGGNFLSELGTEIVL